MKYKLVYIEWEDAMFYPSSWKTATEAKDWAKKTMFTVKESGFLIEENREFITLASKHTVDIGTAEQMFCDFQKIPKTWIRKRKVLKVI